MKILITLAAALALPAAANANTKAIQAAETTDPAATQGQTRAGEPRLTAQRGEAPPAAAAPDKPGATAPEQSTGEAVDKPAPQKPAN